jgi:uncharacterized protein YndB with AHSA1/START domain
MRLADRPTVQVEVEIEAPRDVVWALVADPERMGEFSPECDGGSWLDGADGPAVGARFVGRNHRGDRAWETTSTVVQCEPGRVFAWAVGDAGDASATWRYQFHPLKGGGTRLVESVEIGPGPSGLTAAVADAPDKEEAMVANRTDEHRRNMEATLARLKAVAEQDAAENVAT